MATSVKGTLVGDIVGARRRHCNQLQQRARRPETDGAALNRSAFPRDSAIPRRMFRHWHNAHPLTAGLCVIIVTARC